MIWATQTTKSSSLALGKKSPNTWSLKRENPPNSPTNKTKNTASVLIKSHPRNSNKRKNKGDKKERNERERNSGSNISSEINRGSQFLVDMIAGMPVISGDCGDCGADGHAWPLGRVPWAVWRTSDHHFVSSFLLILWSLFSYFLFYVSVNLFFIMIFFVILLLLLIYYIYLSIHLFTLLSMVCNLNGEGNFQITS